jgi:hypothetical protein
MKAICPRGFLRRRLSGMSALFRYQMISGRARHNCETTLMTHVVAASSAFPKIAVGTLIAERPPHRTERAQFRHSAPTSGA